ncbi:hypothetical protein QQF64_000700 [Cirrhinus molitorella]|uniref:Uncharacterized protein n=1 Tax=Cirrhinus molitorella TaxID=172907 RepID=A0ABR3NXY4_9TELE
MTSTEIHINRKNEMIGTWLSTELDKRSLSGKLAALSLHIVISGLEPRDRSGQGKLADSQELSSRLSL